MLVNKGRSLALLMQITSQGRRGGGPTFFRVQVHVYQRAGVGASLQKLKGMQILKLQCRYVKGVPIVYRRYSKEALFFVKNGIKEEKGLDFVEEPPLTKLF